MAGTESKSKGRNVVWASMSTYGTDSLTKMVPYVEKLGPCRR